MPQNGPKPDKHQVEINGIAIDQLANITLSPVFLAEILSNIEAEAEANLSG